MNILIVKVLNAVFEVCVLQLQKRSFFECASSYTLKYELSLESGVLSKYIGFADDFKICERSSLHNLFFRFFHENVRNSAQIYR